MTHHLMTYFHEQRIERGLTLVQLAMMIGYRNVKKGASRIGQFERDGRVSEELLAKLAEALGVDFPTVEALIREGANDVG